MGAIYARGNTLIKKFNMCSADVKSRLFRSYCSILYCSSLWCSFNATIYRKLQSSYNRMFRYFFKLETQCSISAKCLEFNVDSFKVLMRKCTFGFRNRILLCDNVLVQSITRPMIFVSSKINERWNDLLFTFHLYHII